MLEIPDHKGLREFDRSVRQILGPGSSPEYMVEPRPSGIPILLVYDKGGLSGAAIKGGDSDGEDVTRTVKTILTVPLAIDPTLAGKAPPDRLEVQGIVYSEVRPEGAPGSPPVPTRREVASFLLAADLRVAARQPLNLFCFGAEREGELIRETGAETHFDLMLMLQGWGFRVNRPHIKRCPDISAVVETVRLIEREREKSLFPVDGALVQLNRVAERVAVETALHQEGIVAYAFEAE